MNYQEKIIKVETALDLVQDQDYIVTGLGAAEARLFLSRLHEIADRINQVTVSNCLPMLDADFFAQSEYKDKFRIATWFYSNTMRKNHRNGNISYIPNNLHFAGKKRLSHQRPNIYVGAASMPDQHGYVSLSLSNVYEKLMLEAADTVILEINPNMPRTFGDVELSVKEVDYLIQVDYLAPELPEIEPNEKDLKIGRYIAEHIQDGDCLQLGIGGIPNAVTASLLDKKNLGIHTEMFTSGMIDLIESGAVNNKFKNIHRGKSLCCFALGNQRLYNYMDNNTSVLVLDGNYVNDPYVIAQNDNQVSINTSIEIDLTGQCCSESIGSRQFSGTGGQSDTAVGAQMSKNGRSFIALYTTANILNRECGEREVISKIVPQLKAGAAVSLSRNDVQYVVTEYGLVNLKGTSIAERAELLISIAHPDFRSSLRQEAISLGLM